MSTVYFDTSFYVDLGRAAAAEAERVVGALNQLDVRHVLSPVVFRELARAEDQAAAQLHMLERLAGFRRAPLNLSPAINWLALAPGDHREALAAEHARVPRGHDHAAVFASHADDIALLHVDEPEWRRVLERADHPLRRLGLADRCVCAPSFTELPGVLARVLAS